MLEQVKAITFLLISYGLSSFITSGSESAKDKSGNILEYLTKQVTEENTTASTSLSEDESDFRLPKDVYLKAHSFLARSKAFGNLTFEDTVNFIDKKDSWEEPKYMREKYPFYLSGYDFEGRPIWISEFGKFNIKDAVDLGPEGVADFERYGIKPCIQMLKSLSVKEAKENEARNIIVIADWEGIQLTQVLHVPTIAFVLELLRTYIDIIHRALGQLICINVSPVAEMAFEIARPVLAGLFEKFEMHGNNKAKWQAALRRMMPAETIPPWYGGSKNFKPLAVFG